MEFSEQNAEEELIDGGKVMSLWDHLDELRSRLTRSLIGILLIFFVTFTYAEHVLNYIKIPLIEALPKGVNSIHFTGPLDVFIINIKISFLIGIIFGCPIWLYQFWKFFEPALYPKERKYILPFTFCSVALFFAGVTFAYAVILPLTLEFLLEIGLKIGTPIITIKDYISMLMMLIFGFGIVFETPVILVLLAMLGIVDVESLRKYRSFVIVGILVLGAMLTPPDPISQLALAGPVYVMYEIAIIIISIIKKKEAKNS